MNSLVGLVQPSATGVTLIVAVSIEVSVLVTVKAFISPLPLEARLIEVLSLVQLYVVPVTPPLKLKVPVPTPLHNTRSEGTVTSGVGFTLIVNSLVRPVQPSATGVTLTVAVSAETPVLVPVKPAISPLPLEARSIEVLSLVQLKVVPVTPPLKLKVPVAAPLHNTRSAGTITSGVGFTLIVNSLVEPVQPSATGVTLIIEVSIEVPVLVTVKPATSPLPPEARLIEVLSLVQLKVVPVTPPLKLKVPVPAPLHNTRSAGTVTSGVGFTLTLNSLVGPAQPSATGVTLRVAVSMELPALVAVKPAISPLPLEARFMEVLSFVQLYITPVTPPLKFSVPVPTPLHNTRSTGTITSGVGFTLIVNSLVGPAQPSATGVTLIVAVSVEVPVLTTVKPEILPLPLEARLIEALSFVQL